MEIKSNEKYSIITPLSPKLNEREGLRIKAEALIEKTPKIALDMTYVKDCTIEFIKQLLTIKNICLFNLNSDIFALFFSMNLDKSVKLYVSEIDFIEEKHQLINRKFSVLKSAE